jgi:hypothetical protein
MANSADQVITFLAEHSETVRDIAMERLMEGEGKRHRYVVLDDAAKAHKPALAAPLKAAAARR